MSAGSSAHDRAELVELLAATLGHESALRLVAGAITALGFGGPLLTYEQALAALEHLAKMPGLPGITARLAKTRLRARRVASRDGRVGERR